MAYTLILGWLPQVCWDERALGQDIDGIAAPGRHNISYSPANMVFPDPGLPTIKRLWPPSEAKIATAWGRSYTLPRFGAPAGAMLMVIRVRLQRVSTGGC